MTNIQAIITGFCMLGDIKKELSALEKQCQDENEMPDVAKHYYVGHHDKGNVF